MSQSKVVCACDKYEPEEPCPWCIQCDEPVCVCGQLCDGCHESILHKGDVCAKCPSSASVQHIRIVHPVAKSLQTIFDTVRQKLKTSKYCEKESPDSAYIISVIRYQILDISSMNTSYLHRHRDRRYLITDRYQEDHYYENYLSLKRQQEREEPIPDDIYVPPLSLLDMSQGRKYGVYVPPSEDPCGGSCGG